MRFEIGMTRYPHCPTAIRRTAQAWALLAGFGALCVSSTALAVPYYYVDWTQANIAQGTASGVITLPDASQVTVTFAATYADGSHGTLYGAQINGGTNFWSPSTPYTSTQVDNAPPGTDILQLSGGLNQIYTVTLSEAIKDPIMSIVSLGRGGVPTTYDFNTPFTIVSQGAGYFGGTSTSLTQLPGDVLQGTEGHGTIQFLGTFSTFSWTVPTPEDWHGFTFGIRTTEAIEPTAVPDQSHTVALLGLGLLGMFIVRRRQTR